MARGRKRKIGVARDKSGKIAKPTTTAERRKVNRVEPTPEMARMKRAYHGAEIGDPLVHLDLTNPQREALSHYFSLRRAAGWGQKRITPRYDDPAFLGGHEGEGRDDRERKTKVFYDACVEALRGAGFPAYRTADNLFTRRIMTGRLSDLRKAADALAVFFRISKAHN